MAKMIVVNGVRYREEDAPTQPAPKVAEPVEETPAPTKRRPAARNKARTSAANKTVKTTLDAEPNDED